MATTKPILATPMLPGQNQRKHTCREVAKSRSQGFSLSRFRALLLSRFRVFFTSKGGCPRYWSTARDGAVRARKQHWMLTRMRLFVPRKGRPLTRTLRGVSALDACQCSVIRTAKGPVGQVNKTIPREVSGSVLVSKGGSISVSVRAVSRTTDVCLIHLNRPLAANRVSFRSHHSGTQFVQHVECCLVPFDPQHLLGLERRHARGKRRNEKSAPKRPNRGLTTNGTIMESFP